MLKSIICGGENTPPLLILSLEGREGDMGALSVISNEEEQKPSITIEEIINMDEHAELINDRLVIKNQVTPEHDNATTVILTSFVNYISQNNGDCKAFSNVVSLHCEELRNENESNNKKNYYLPDIMIVCDKSGIKPDGVHVVPNFIAEITSKSTRRDDYNSKREIYREIGVQEYWIVDLQKKLVIKNTLDDGVYLSEMVRYPNITQLNVETYPGLNIDLSSIFDFVM